MNKSLSDKLEKKELKIYSFLFAERFKNLIKPFLLNNKRIKWCYWGGSVGNTKRIFIVSMTKGTCTLEDISKEDPKNNGEKKIVKYKNKKGYFVFIVDCSKNIKSFNNPVFKFKKVFRKAKKRDARNLAHKLWFKQFYPTEEYRPFLPDSSMEKTEEQKKKLQEKGKKLFEILKERNKRSCPRCNNTFSNMSKNVFAGCPVCGTKFFVGEKRLDLKPGS